MTFANLSATSVRKFFSLLLLVSESGRQDLDFSHFEGRGDVKIRVGWGLRAQSALEMVSLTSPHLGGFSEPFTEVLGRILLSWVSIIFALDFW